MVVIETTRYEGSELLDHRQLMRDDSTRPATPLSSRLSGLDLAGVLDAAFAASADLKGLFRAALEHYELAALETLHLAASSLGAARAPLTVPELLPESALPPDPASAVVVGVIDEALPIARPGFARHLASHWEMAANRHGAVAFGTEITGTALAAPLSGPSALRGTPGRYVDLGLSDMGSQTGRRFRRFRSHGASVMGLGAEGLGAQHPLISVGLPAEVVEDTSGALLPLFVLLGVLHVVARTRALAAQIDPSGGLALPVVITISYGVLSGPKDGSDPLSRAIDALCAPNRPAIPGLGPVHVVWPMGNGRQARSHAMILPDTGPLSLSLLPDDRTPSYVSLRAAAPADGRFGLRAGLRLPGLARWIRTPRNPAPGTRVTMAMPDGSTVHAYFNRETATGRPARDLILLAFGSTVLAALNARALVAGRWSLRAEADGPVTVFVQRDDSIDGLRSGGRQARLGHPDYRRHDDAGREITRDARPPESPIRRWRTFNAFATGAHIWRIGGRFEVEGTDVPYSGLGAEGDPLAVGSALAVSDRSRAVAGVPVRALLGGAGLREGGTSVAAPQFARALALAMRDARERTGAWPDGATLAAQLSRPAPARDGQARR